MGRYYLHLKEGQRLSYDPEGFDLPDPEAARKEALRSARELCEDEIAEGRDISKSAFVIVDEAGRQLGVVSLSGARAAPSR